MRILKVFPGMREFDMVKELYIASFPESFRIPVWRMALLSMLRPSVELLAYFDGDLFCGFTFTICTRRHLYINFFAVVPELRSHGYGGRIGAMLMERYPRPMIGMVKMPVEGTEDYEEDMRRVRFWEAHGTDFYGYQHVFTDANGVKFLAGATGTEYDRDAYQEIFDKRSLGFASVMRLIFHKPYQKD